MPRFLAVALLVAAAAPAFGEDSPSAARYAFVPVAAGALRLDTESGEVSLCVGGGGTAPACTRVSENIRLTVGERARLEAKVAELEARLAMLEAHERQSAAPLGDGKAIHRVKVLADRLMDHFVDAVRAVKNQL